MRINHVGGIPISEEQSRQIEHYIRDLKARGLSDNEALQVAEDLFMLENVVEERDTSPVWRPLSPEDDPEEMKFAEELERRRRQSA
ncbi:MAG: hypothetical protein HY347_09135 [candidate division NC10 bacterium]|nr:hypothetical protein [candidate division NC10 bacterium]